MSSFRTDPIQPADQHQGTKWLPAEERQWVSRYEMALSAIYGEFHATGQWPDPVELQRLLRARGARSEVIAAVPQVPALLGRREWSPPRLALSWFGIGCCRASRPLLKRVLEVIHIALERFDAPDVPNSLSRKEVVDRLALTAPEADRLSKVLMADAFFLGGGNANPDDWRQPVDPRVLEFEDVESVEELLVRLAGIRQIGNRPAANVEIESASQRSSWADQLIGQALNPQHPIGYVLWGVLAILLGGLVLAVLGVGPGP